MRYARPIRRCDYCRAGEGIDRASHVFTSDDGLMRLCRRCIAESVTLISDAMDEGLDA